MGWGAPPSTAAPPGGDHYGRRTQPGRRARLLLELDPFTQLLFCLYIIFYLFYAFRLLVCFHIQKGLIFAGFGLSSAVGKLNDMLFDPSKGLLQQH